MGERGGASGEVLRWWSEEEWVKEWKGQVGWEAWGEE